MTKLLEKIIYEKQPIKSKVKFSGDFYGELENFMKMVEKSVKKEIIPNFSVIWTEYGNSSLKIKLNDRENLIEKLIVCNFTYNKTDEKFGYLDPQFIVTEKSKKTKIYNLGKFPILDKENLINSFLEKLIFIINEY